MEIILNITYCCLFLLIIRNVSFFKDNTLSVNFLSFVFLLKLVTGIILFWIYTCYYTDRSKADIYKYFDDSLVLYNAFWTNPTDFFKMLFGIQSNTDYYVLNYFDKMIHWIRVWERPFFNDNHTIIRINAVFRFFSFGYYTVHSIFFNFMSFIGLFCLYKGLKSFFYESQKLLAMCIFFTPSLLFWTSGVLKESVLFFALGVFIYSIHKLNQAFSSTQNKQKITIYCLLLISSVCLLGFIKYYVILILIPVIFAYLLVNYTKRKSIFLTYLSVMILFSFGTVWLKYLSPKLDIIRIFYKKQDDFIRHAIEEKTGSLLNVTPLEENLLSFIKNIPEALFNTFFQPFFISTSNSPFVLLASLENLFLFGFIIVSIIFRKKTKEINFNLLFLLLFFIVGLYLIIGWTTPVMGAIVRYRIPGLLASVLVCLLLLDSKKPIFKRYFKN